MTRNSMIRIALVVTVAVMLEMTMMLAAAQAVAGQTTTQAAPQNANTNRKPRRAKARKARRGQAAGMPTTVPGCIDRLIELASADPMPAYEGMPEDITNNGLLWNDPKSKCSIGTDTALRLKVSQMAGAWRRKDAATVRSLLQEIKSAAPQS